MDGEREECERNPHAEVRRGKKGNEPKGGKKRKSPAGRQFGLADGEGEEERIRAKRIRTKEMAK
jgi:hypothetical protein